MNRLPLIFLLAACPAALAQEDDYVEGRKLAAAFSQADLDALGRCQARMEGVSLILQDLEGWMAAQSQTSALQGLQKQKEDGATLIENFAEVRQHASTAKGMTLSTSNAARDSMLETFMRRLGEDEHAFYTRAQPETRLPPQCREALKRGRWKIEIDELG